MRIDEDRALKILEEECGRAISDKWPVLWEAEIKELCALADASSQTYIAAFATQALAKATDLRAYTLSKDVGDNAGGYSARGFCTRVVAAHAPRLGIDLGVTGREPLNNQPFFPVTYMDEARPRVRGDALKAYDHLIDLLRKLNEVDDAEKARKILRAFLRLRLKEGRVAPSADAGDMTRAELSNKATEFVSNQSELGKRAQAMTTAFLDAAFGTDRVNTERIHDPDRKFPGDVIVHSKGNNGIYIAFEVRDKPVSRPDLYHFVSKVSSAELQRAGIMAVDTGQDSAIIDQITAVHKFASEREVRLRVYLTWAQLMDDLIFWTDTVPSRFVNRAFKALVDRAVELEVSQEGINWWAAQGKTSLPN